MVFIGGAVMFVKGAATFIGKGSLVIKRSFKIAVMFVSRGSLAVKSRGKASKAYTDGACVGRAGVVLLVGPLVGSSIELFIELSVGLLTELLAGHFNRVGL